MFQLSDTQLLLASKGLAIEPGFGWELDNPIEKWFYPLVDKLKSIPSLGMEVVCEGGSETYAHVFLYDPTMFPKTEEDELKKTLRYEGISIYFCLLGPYAAIGNSHSHMSYPKKSSSASGKPPVLALGGVIDKASNTILIEQVAFNEVSRSEYRVLTRQELQVHLPNGIEPMDVCGLGPPPYTYFDLLFNDTD